MQRTQGTQIQNLKDLQRSQSTFPGLSIIDVPAANADFGAVLSSWDEIRALQGPDARDITCPVSVAVQLEDESATKLKST